MIHSILKKFKLILRNTLNFKIGTCQKSIYQFNTKKELADDESEFYFKKIFMVHN